MDRTSPDIEGNIIFRHTVTAFSNSTIHIYLEDISYADTNAIRLAHVAIPGITHRGVRETIVPFRLRADSEYEIRSSADYGVRVWVNISNDGIAGTSDLFSDSVIRVLTAGYGNRVEIIFN